MQIAANPVFSNMSGDNAQFDWASVFNRTKDPEEYENQAILRSDRVRELMKKILELKQNKEANKEELEQLEQQMRALNRNYNRRIHMPECLR